MKSLVILCALAACGASQLLAPGPVAVRAPSYDSAIIQSHRLGGNFAYSTNEAHAYAVQTPVIGLRSVPVGVSYEPGTPIVKTATQYIIQQIPQYAYAYPHLHAAPQVAFPYPYTFGTAVIAAEAANKPGTQEQLTDAEPATAELTVIEPSAAELADTEPVTAELTDTEPATAELTNAEPSTAELINAEPATAELTFVEPATAELADPEPAAVNERIVDTL
nr:proline-rich protein 27-like [Cherax quadricarinatus]